MVNIKYYPEKTTLKMTGHAGCTDPLSGEDIICAACSAIYYNLRAVFDAYNKDDMFTKFSARESSGKISLTAVPAERAMELVAHDIWYALTGFRLIEANYPDSVKVEVITGKKA